MSFEWNFCSTHHGKQQQAPTRLPHTDCSGRAQAHTRTALGQKLSQQRRGEESDAVDERSGGVDELLLAVSTPRNTAVSVSS